MNNIHKTIILLLFISLFQSCNNFKIDDYSQESVEMTLSDSSISFGKKVAKEISETIHNLHEMGVDYSDAEKSQEFKVEFYNNLYKASPTAQKYNLDINSVTDDILNQFITPIDVLTTIQIEFIERIISEINVSKTHFERLDRLVLISHDIHRYVPSLQQERLFNVISVLYYSLTEIQNLKQCGKMIETPNSLLNRRIAITKGFSENNDDEYDEYDDTCHKIIAAVWTIAIGEPTPAGEIVAAIVTIYVAGSLMYEVMLCPDDSEDTDNEIIGPTEDSKLRDYCNNKFSRCKSTIPNGCSTCLQFCLVQGYWPPVSTHNCTE